MDSELLLELYTKQAKMIYYYLKKNGCSHEDAEDIVQESYMKYIAYSSGVSSNKALSYIFSIAMNEFKKVLKRKGKEPVMTIDDEHFWNNFISEDDPVANVLKLESKIEVVRTLNHLQENYRQLLLLKYELEWSYKEMALLLGMKEETVRTYLYRARKDFQKKWGHFYE
ncbi:RNA polymerase subunit sigma-24 [Alkalihalophilus pseudofirmus]|nr:RNA polymerase subunit sigma-24 [Alkalihalophilus pseudofirmus]